MQQYDHRTKAGNEGDIVKHPALVAALYGLLAEHDDIFRYADAFAGRWDNDLRTSAAWKQGIEKFAPLWNGANPDIQFWREQWMPDPRVSYPGSTKVAQKILASRGHYEIRAFEIIEAYAVGLRDVLGAASVFTRAATAADWLNWQPNLLFIDPPGLRSDKNPDYPTLESLLFCAKNVANVLMWLPMLTDRSKSGPVLPLHAATVESWSECARRGVQVLAARWDDGGPLSGCLLAYRLGSASVAERVGAAVRDLVNTMGTDWRIV